MQDKTKTSSMSRVDVLEAENRKLRQMLVEVQKKLDKATAAEVIKYVVDTCAVIMVICNISCVC